MYDAGKYVCAICAAPKILGHGGYLVGKKACIYPGMDGELTGADVNHNEVNRDANVITSRGLGTAIPFALEIIAAIQGLEYADEMAKKIVFRA
jgi:4-methyl-5(b-hydroxyethyl)-thiazole monophosphate biosynthesis